MNGDSDRDEIWSNYFQIKTKLMDYNENLNDSLAIGRMLLRSGYNIDSKAFKDNMAKAHRHAYLVFNLGLSSMAIPKTAKQEEIDKIRKIVKGDWKKIEELEYCLEKYIQWFRESGLYDVTVKIRKDNSPL